MNGLDLIIFGGGIGENSFYARETILKGMDYLGIKVDKSRNRNLSTEGKISKDDSKVAIFVVNVDEEVVIARETYEVVKNS